MVNFVAVDIDRHAEMGWRRPSDYLFAAIHAICPLVATELAKACTALPIAFIKVENHYELVAVLSVVPQRNFFVGPQGQWLANYIPAMFRTYPFRMALQAGADQAILCVDESSGLLGPRGDGYQPFFLADGTISPELKDALEIATEIERQRAAVNQVVAVLDEARIIRPWQFEYTIDGQTRPVDGLYQIDETALRELDDTAFLKLRTAGALPIVYMQLLSMGLVQVYDDVLKLHRQLTPSQPVSGGMSAFQMKNNDTIRFT